MPALASLDGIILRIFCICLMTLIPVLAAEEKDQVTGYRRKAKKSPYIGDWTRWVEQGPTHCYGIEEIEVVNVTYGYC